ncbi:hypothetical protein HPB50_012317 [Hyalomma asiaticum]|uniref:Uncharacterized protein n=1 Tax=Hyalomma asiaticum TaxID=266040 RepID=A0ACB7TJB1_HYAAI|nr:hypothetical protein HPB50_012317 [Hyalomma asiaticum]
MAAPTENFPPGFTLSSTTGRSRAYDVLLREAGRMLNCKPNRQAAPFLSTASSQGPFSLPDPPLQPAEEAAAPILCTTLLAQTSSPPTTGNERDRNAQPHVEKSSSSGDQEESHASDLSSSSREHPTPPSPALSSPQASAYNRSTELADPMADKHIAKQRRAAYLTEVGNPLSIPSIPSKVFTRRESVLLRRVQTGTLLTSFLLNRFYRGGTPPPVSGFCSTCNWRADLNPLCWECPVYIPARLRALATINRGPWPSSLRTWACPDPTPPDRAIEFWRALLMFLQDPAAPPVGDRLRDSHKIQAAPT